MKRTLAMLTVTTLVAGCGDAAPSPLEPGSRAAEAAKVPAAAGITGPHKRIRMLDACDPNSAVPEWLIPLFEQLPFKPRCLVHPGRSNVDLEEFFAALPQGGHPTWRFDGPKKVRHGETILLSNDGGILYGHSFTLMGEYSGSCFQEPIRSYFNQAVPETTVPPECAGVFGELVRPGETRTITASDLPLGTQKIQCLVHPWMRMELEVLPAQGE